VASDHSAAHPAPIKLRCAISGARETLTVDAVGAYGVSFTHGMDASVIVRGVDLLRVRAILDVQIENWQKAQSAAPKSWRICPDCGREKTLGLGGNMVCQPCLSAAFWRKHGA
jgi:hypothetical protein